MKTILFVHQSAELYGSDKTLQVLISRLNTSLYKAVVILPFDGPLKPVLEAEGADVFIAPVLKLHRSMFSAGNLSLFLKQIKEAVRTADELNKIYKFDVVYSNTLAVLLGMIYARKRRLKHIWHVHEIIKHPKSIASLFPWLLKYFANIVVCNSEATKKNLTERVRSLEKKCVVVYNGVDAPQQALNNFMREELGFEATDIVVTLVGRISRLKGHKLMLEAFLQHLQEHRSIKLLFVGSPVPGQEFYLTEVEDIIRNNKIDDRVKLLPFTTSLHNIWNITDIAVMPSTEAESFGLAALEAMLHKRPVIGSDHGGLSEIIVNGETGFLSEPCNAQELALYIIKLAQDPAMRKEFGSAGYNRAVAKFSEAKYAEGIEQLLKHA